MKIIVGTAAALLVLTGCVTVQPASEPTPAAEQTSSSPTVTTPAASDGFTLLLDQVWHTRSAKDRNGMCTGWQLYPATVYRAFTNTLTGDARFGMTDAQIRDRLGAFLAEHC